MQRANARVTQNIGLTNAAARNGKHWKHVKYARKLTALAVVALAFLAVTPASAAQPILTVAAFDPATDSKPDPHRVTAPSRGLAGRYQDSNVYEVWKGASHAERSFWLCVRRHESMSYTGENPVSTASGAGQWLNGTWDGIKPWVKFKGEYVAKQYDEAKDAPAWVQDLVFRHVWKRNGLSMWRGTHCGYGT